MTGSTFTADSTFATRYAMLGRALPALLVPVGMTLYTRPATGWIVFFSALALLSVGIAVARLNWGDQVTFAGNALSVQRKGATVKSVAAADIANALVNGKTLLVAWNEGGKRRSIILPRESFSAESFKQLTDAFLAFVPSEKLTRREA